VLCQSIAETTAKSILEKDPSPDGHHPYVNGFKKQWKYLAYRKFLQSLSIGTKPLYMIKQP